MRPTSAICFQSLKSQIPNPKPQIRTPWELEVGRWALVANIQLCPLAVLLGGQRNQRSERGSGTPLPPDDLSHVARRRRQRVDRHASPLVLGHAYCIRTIDERARDHFNHGPDRVTGVAGPFRRRHYCAAGASTAGAADRSRVRCLPSSVRTESDGFAPSFSQCSMRALFKSTRAGFDRGLYVPTFSTKLLSRAERASMTMTRKYGFFVEPIRRKRIDSINPPI